MKYAQITEYILDFYRVQPGVKEELMEKLELYLVLITSLYVDVMEELEVLQEMRNEDLFEEILEVLNGYLNSIGEEHESIFPEKENQFQIIPVFSNSKMDALRFFESLYVWNGGEKDLLSMGSQLQELQQAFDEKERQEELIWTTVKLIVQRIYMKMMIRMEDLI